MAHRGPRSGIRGHGPSQAPRRHAWPTTQRIGRKGGQPGYLKTWGSRPAEKRRQERRAA